MGGFVRIDRSTVPFKVAKYFLWFLTSEPCRYLPLAYWKSNVQLSYEMLSIVLRKLSSNRLLVNLNIDILAPVIVIL